jgi:FkbM family methyltransferase
MLSEQHCQVYAFEAVPVTFAKLVASIETLGLRGTVHPIAAAVLDRCEVARLKFSRYDSLFAQVQSWQTEPPDGETTFAASLTLENFANTAGVIPSLIKIDVEGSETRVLIGARALLNGASRPALMFEYNPNTLRQTGAEIAEFDRLQAGYTFFYIDDFEQPHRIAFAAEIRELAAIDWACNIFAVPVPEQLPRWHTTALAVRGILSM